MYNKTGKISMGVKGMRSVVWRLFVLEMRSFSDKRTNQKSKITIKDSRMLKVRKTYTSAKNKDQRIII